jgi:lysophospholipase L1-like esterase
MNPSEPTVRYYDTRGRRRGAWRALVVVLVAGAAFGGYAVGSGLFRSDAAGSSVAALDPNLPASDQTDEASGNGSLDAGSAAVFPKSVKSVAMIGDSITKASSDAIRYVLGAHGVTDVTIDAQVSRRIGLGDGKGSPLAGVAVLDGMLGDKVDPDIWVIALGTNDAGQYKSADDYFALIDTVVGMLPADAPLVWVDVYRPDHLAAAEQFNEQLHRRLDGRDHTSIVSWFELASAKDEQILRSDHIHPNADGTAVFAGLVEQGIAALD